MDLIKNINSFFFDNIDDYSKRSRLSGLLISLISGNVLTSVYFFLDDNFTLMQYIGYNILILLKLMLLKYRKEFALKCIIVFDWIVIPHAVLQKDEALLRNIAIYIVTPFLIYLSQLPKKFYFIIAMCNIISVLSAKPLIDDIFQSATSMQKGVIEKLYETLIISIISSWLIEIIHFIRFNNILIRQQNTSNELEKSNHKLQKLVRELEAKNKELTRSKINLEEALKSKDQMLTGISHELRNPLNSLLGYIDLVLEDKVGIAKEHQDKLKISILCGNILLSLINDLLDASKFAADKLELNNDNSNLFNLLDKIWKINYLKIKQKNLRAELYVAKSCPKYIEIDEQRVTQILLNLLSNSIKFTEKGHIKLYITWYENSSLDDVTKPHEKFTEIIKEQEILFRNLGKNDTPNKFSEISQTPTQENLITENDYYANVHNLPKFTIPRRASCMNINQYHVIGIDKIDVANILNERFLKDPIISSSDTQGSGILKLEIIDSGCGINSEAQKKLFEPFEQEDGSVTRKYGGTGLGLFIIKKLVNKMGGIVKLYSKKLFGSNFIVAFPSKKSSEKHNEHQFVKEISNKEDFHNGKKVLIVDDNPFNLKLINDYCEKMNFTTILCLNGNEAYLKFTEHPIGFFSLVTLDIQMPELDGISTAKLIRNYEKSTLRDNKNYIPIIFISGNSQELERKECLDPNGPIRADFFFRKPIKFGDFQNTVNKILKKGKPRRKRFNILVVDDDIFNIEVITANLAKNNLIFDTACNGAEAFSKVTLRKNYFDFILMDCEMPIMDGITATKEIKKYIMNYNLHEVCIIGMTGHNDKKKIEECMNAGMIKVYCKPVSFSCLIDFILT